MNKEQKDLVLQHKEKTNPWLFQVFKKWKSNDDNVAVETSTTKEVVAVTPVTESLPTSWAWEILLATTIILSVAASMILRLKRE